MANVQLVAIFYIKLILQFRITILSLKNAGSLVISNVALMLLGTKEMGDKKKKAPGIVAVTEGSEEKPPATSPLSSQIEHSQAVDSFKETWTPMNGPVSISHVFHIPKKRE